MAAVRGDGGTVAQATGSWWHKEQAARSGPLFLSGSGSGLLLLLPGWIRWRAAKSCGGGWIHGGAAPGDGSRTGVLPSNGSNGGEEDPASNDGGAPWMGSLGLSMFFYLIYRGGQQTVSDL